MKTQQIEDVMYSYSYFEEKTQIFSKLFAPRIIEKLPRISMALPKINLVENFELSVA